MKYVECHCMWLLGMCPEFCLENSNPTLTSQIYIDKYIDHITYVLCLLDCIEQTEQEVTSYKSALALASYQQICNR